MNTELTKNGIDVSVTRLEEQIRRVTELCRDLRQERAILQKEIAGLLLQIDTLTDEKRKLERRIDHLVSNRGELRHRVEAILDAVAALEIEAESTSK